MQNAECSALLCRCSMYTIFNENEIVFVSNESSSTLKCDHDNAHISGPPPGISPVHDHDNIIRAFEINVAEAAKHRSGDDLYDILLHRYNALRNEDDPMFL